MIIIFSRLFTKSVAIVALVLACVVVLFEKVKHRTVALVAFCAAGATMAFVPAISGATETETKVGEVATQVGSEGVAIVLAILTALIGLLVAIIIIPKAVALIRRFV